VGLRASGWLRIVDYWFVLPLMIGENREIVQEERFVACRFGM